MVMPTSNYFELFGLPVGFDVDGEALALRYRDLQRALHPDRFAGASDQERRLSVQQAAQVNEGFRVLKAPLARARYLLELRGLPVDDRDTSMDPAFLMEQMELREALAEVSAAKDRFLALEHVRDEIETRERGLIADLRRHFADPDPSSLEQARQDVRKLQFMQRLLSEAEELEEKLVHESEISD
ncbi:MAG: Fe-S protein assembly co-chaperone HscB [Thiohalomonadaceae bacterium]